MGKRVWVCATVPLFSVLAHTHSSSVARGWVATGALTDLEADAAAGAAWRPGGPGGPRSVSMEMQSATSVKESTASGNDVGSRNPRQTQTGHESDTMIEESCMFFFLQILNMLYKYAAYELTKLSLF